MTTLQIEAGDLHAEENSRRVTGMLLPYGETGRTNLGRLTVDKDSNVTIPADPSVVTYNDSHQRNRPLGRAVDLHATDTGVVATLEVAKVPEGDDLLAELRAGKPGARKRLSVEMADIVVRAGKLVSGRIYGAAAVVAGAFPSADLHAEDVADDAPTDPPADTTDTTDTDDPENPDGTPPEDDTEKEQPVSADLTAARAPAGGAGARRRKRDAAQPETADDLFATLARAYAGGEPDRDLLAALDQGVQADIESAGAPAWLNEVWSQRTHRQKYVPLYTPAPLNALRGVGWKFSETTDAGDEAGTLATPTVGAYAGYPAEPTSSEVKTEAVDWKADRVAGANEFDRAFVDFDTPDFWRGFFREVANDASRKLDAAALTHRLTAGNYVDVTDPDTVTGSTDPSDDTAAYQVAISLIVTGIQTMQDRATPTFAMVGADLWRPLVLTERQNALEYLSVALGLDPEDGTLEQFQILPSRSAELTGRVMVGAKESATFYGPKTVRASTITIANGGVQEGLFAYYKAFTADPYSFVRVAPTAGV